VTEIFSLLKKPAMRVALLVSWPSSYFVAIAFLPKSDIPVHFESRPPVSGLSIAFVPYTPTCYRVLCCLSSCDVDTLKILFRICFKLPYYPLAPLLPGPCGASLFNRGNSRDFANSSYTEKFGSKENINHFSTCSFLAS